MGSALQYLFESEAKARIVKFLRARGERARIIAPDWVRVRVCQNLPQDHPPLSAVWSEEVPAHTPSAEGARNFIIIAEDTEREKAMLASVAGFSHAKAHGLFGNVLPALLCGPNGMARGLPTAGLKRYAMLCIPRSGSRYLASILNRKGLGVPQEHLRDPLATVITDGKLGFPAAFASLERFGQHNGIFGTKLISSFLIKASGGKLAELESNIRWMIARGYRIVHLHRPLEEAAVSSYIASRLEKWHFFGELDATMRSRLDEMAYDERAAWDEYIRIRAQKVALDYLAKKFHLPTIHYADIQTDVERVASLICRYLDVDPDTLKAGSAPVPVATRTESPTYSAFAGALDQLLHRRRHEIGARTARRLQGMLRIDHAAAERMAETAPAHDARPALQEAPQAP